MSLVMTPGPGGGGGGIGNVRSFSVPSKAAVDQPVNAVIVGKVTSPDTVNNFVLGVAYQDGPTNYIEYYNGKSWSKLSKHSIAFVTVSNASSGGIYKAKIIIRFPDEGTYDVRGVVGADSGNGIIVDDFIDREVTVVKGSPFPATHLSKDLMYPLIGAGIGALAGYIATSDVKGVVAGAAAGGGLGYTVNYVSKVLPAYGGKR